MSRHFKLGKRITKLKLISLAEALPQTVFLAGVFVMPLVFNPWATVAYELPKVWFFYLWIKLLVITSVVITLITKRKIMSSWFVAFLLLFGLVAVISSVLG